MPKRRAAVLAPEPEFVPEVSMMVMAGPAAGHSFQRRDSLADITIGRNPEFAAFAIKDPAVSERHAEVTWLNGAWHLADVGSSCGTTLNGAPLKKSKRPRILSDGDVVAFGPDSVVSCQIFAPAVGMTVKEYYAEGLRRQIEDTKVKAQIATKCMQEQWQELKAAACAAQEA